MLPDVKYYSPSTDISWIVRQFEHIRHCGSRGLTDKFVPRADASIVFQFGNLPRMLTPVNKVLPGYFIAPLLTSANSINVAGQLDCFIVTCKPTVLSRILKICLAPPVELYVSPEPALFTPLWKKMKEERSAERRIAIFSSFLKEIHPGPYIPDETDLVYDAILQKGISRDLHQIISDFSMSRRTLQRKFRVRLGTTPKMLLRIIRINHIWDSVPAGARIDYHDLVFFGNYFDQTHLIKDFKSLTGETPDVFFRRNLGFTRILSGKCRRMP